MTNPIVPEEMKKIREILEKVKSPIPCCTSCEEDRAMGFGDDIEGCCCRHISVDQALTEIKKAVEVSEEKIADLIEVGLKGYIAGGVGSINDWSKDIASAIAKAYREKT